MYAVVEISGLQIKVESGAKVWVPYMEKVEPGEKLTFDRVLFVKDEDEIKVGQPVVEGASVKATLIQHEKGQKLIVFKKRRRKSSQTKKGHREKYSVLKIEEITV